MRLFRDCPWISIQKSQRGDEPLRPIDLARVAGISTQQVRNYLASGVLPPAERTDSGYRVLTSRHVDALRTVRRLATGHGWARTRVVMVAVHAGDVASALAAIDESHAQLARERTEVAATVAAFATVAAEPAPATRRTARIGEVARAVGAHPPVLRQWEQRGLLRPGRDQAGYRAYDAGEQRAAHLVALLRRGNVEFEIVAAALDAVRTTGSTTRALAELARRDEQLQETSRRRLVGTAALAAYLYGDS